MDKPKLLIIGASIYQHHLYNLAKKMGFQVYSIDQNPEAAMLRFADGFKVIDIYDIDAAVKYANEIDVDVVTSINLDQGMVAVNEIQARLGLSHKDKESILKSTRKDKMRREWEKAGVNIPEYEIFEYGDIDQAEKYVRSFNRDVIVKPVDNAAKRGISKIRDSEKDFRNRLQNAYDRSESNKIIVEEFIDGELYFAPTYITQNGDINCNVISQNINDNFVQLEYIAPPSIDEDKKKLIKKEAQKAALCFGSGPYHSEIIYSKSRGPILIETSPRISYATVALTRLVFGFDPVKQLLGEAYNDDLPHEPPPSPTVSSARLVHVQPPPGATYIGGDIQRLKSLDYIYEIVPIIKEGEKVCTFKTNDDRVFYFVASSNYKYLKRYIKRNLFK